MLSLNAFVSTLKPLPQIDMNMPDTVLFRCPICKRMQSRSIAEDGKSRMVT